MNPSNERRRYRGYLLRLWQIGEGGSIAWRISLEDPRTGERHGFASLNALFAFLHDQTGETPAAPGSPDSASSVE